MSKFDKNHNILSIKTIYLQGKLKKRNQSEKIYLQYILIYLTKHLYSEYIKNSYKLVNKRQITQEKKIVNSLKIKFE